MQTEKLNKFSPVNILGNFFSHAEAVRNLGVWYDRDFSFTRHVKNICKSCFAQIQDDKHLRGYLCIMQLLLLQMLFLLVDLNALDLCKLQ